MFFEISLKFEIHSLKSTVVCPKFQKCSFGPLPHKELSFGFHFIKKVDQYFLFNKKARNKTTTDSQT